ncbi:HAD family hydrolase [Mycobacterium lepraemurium]|nr:HAD family hydrolase [Mycobacterium lepraemurium]
MFDVDGSLVDSNYLHVHTWQRAFNDEDIAVASWQIHRCIGMDGSTLVRTLSGDAPEDELEILRKVLDCDDVIAATTSSRDVDTAKPEPGIVRVALDRAGVRAEEAVFVGDAVWDAHAARGAGLACIGLCSGGIARDELRAAGAEPVFADPQDLPDHLESTRIAALARGG